MSGIRRILSYAFTHARVRGLRSRMLDPLKWRALINAGSLRECLDILLETSYGRRLEEIKEIPDVRILENIVREEVIDSIASAAKASPKAAKHVMYRYLAKYEVDFVKTLITMVYSGEKRSDFLVIPPIRGLSRDLAERVLGASSLEEAVDILEGARRYKVLRATLDEVTRLGSLLPMESALYMNWLIGMIVATRMLPMDEQMEIRRILTLDIDAINFMIAVRAKQAGLEYEDIKDYFLTVSSRYIAEERGAGGRIGALDESHLYNIVSTPRLEDLSPEGFGGYASVVRRALELYSKTKDVEAFRRAFEEEKLRLARKYTFSSMFKATFAMAFVITREREYRDLVTILKAKEAGIPREELMNYAVIPSILEQEA